MKTIIITDIHNRIGWIEEFLKTQTYDEVVFTGDYFDNFGDGPTIATETARWLADSIIQPKRKHLFGNHDIWYSVITDYAYCTGNSQEKHCAIQKVFPMDLWQRFGLCYYTQGWLLSHAGVHRQHFEHPIKGITIEHIQNRCEEALSNLRGGIWNSVFTAGWSRGGPEKAGGIVWCDFDCEFKPIKGINQIVGHTPHKKPERKVEPNDKDAYSINWGLDTCSNHIGIIEDGKFSIIENPLARPSSQWGTSTCDLRFPYKWN